MASGILIDRDICTSCGLCNELAPNTFGLDDDEIAYVIDQAGDPVEDIQEAIDGCPVECISWED
jgi:ferredoxin